jgi:restriction endonuclease S subunit
MMPPDTVLIALTGATTGKTALLKIEACGNQSVTGILPSENHNSEFLLHYFKTQREVIFNKAWGGAQPHINQKYVKDYLVPLPPLQDQIRIADILSRTESLIAKRKESIRLLDDLVKSMFLDMFGDPYTNTKKWQMHRLEDLCGFITKGTTPKSKDIYRNMGKILPIFKSISYNG